jgi:hypothetical protein
VVPALGGISANFVGVKWLRVPLEGERGALTTARGSCGSVTLPNNTGGTDPCILRVALSIYACPSYWFNHLAWFALTSLLHTQRCELFKIVDFISIFTVGDTVKAQIYNGPFWTAILIFPKVFSVLSR